MMGMKGKILNAAAVLAAAILIVSTGHAFSDGVVASLDGEKITVATLSDYVSEVAGDKYAPLLNDGEGLRTLADFYINRALLLDYARQTVDREDVMVRNHNARSVDESAMVLTALLKSEVQGRVRVSAEEVEGYMKTKRVASEKVAERELASLRKAELMTALIAKVRMGHDIRSFD
ncbi:hypothetical protein [uncultured Desulfuromonas sp.]|uniref:hypothetical protein n=1 Tax=uncultured Desulfuromonas sp. TaxID=181013 RepID=UPI002615F0FA|nr:hypothetical protein [uncultured Desulfuromonas sp.]